MNIFFKLKDNNKFIIKKITIHKNNAYMFLTCNKKYTKIIKNTNNNVYNKKYKNIIYSINKQSIFINNQFNKKDNNKSLDNNQNYIFIENNFKLFSKINPKGKNYYYFNRLFSFIFAINSLILFLLLLKRLKFLSNLSNSLNDESDINIYDQDNYKLNEINYDKLSYLPECLSLFIALMITLYMSAINKLSVKNFVFESKYSESDKAFLFVQKSLFFTNKYIYEYSSNLDINKSIIINPANNIRCPTSNRYFSINEFNNEFLYKSNKHINNSSNKKYEKNYFVVEDFITDKQLELINLRGGYRSTNSTSNSFTKLNNIANYNSDYKNLLKKRIKAFNNLKKCNVIAFAIGISNIYFVLGQQGLTLKTFILNISI